jgi:glycosyl transferase family 25
MWEFIEKIVYINLDERPDRRKNMEKMTKPFGDKAIRFSAIKDKQGIVGCVKSHIAVLKMALDKGWKNLLVLEDDAEWNEYYTGYNKLKHLAELQFDAIMLGGTAVVYYPDTLRLVNAQTTTAYLINAHYIPTLLANFEEGLVGLLNTNHRDSYSLDMYWKSIQARDTWFVIMPPLVYQTPGYSDIEKKEVDYVDFFGVERKPKSTLPYKKLFKK